MSQGLIDAVTESVQTADSPESSTFDVDSSVFDGFEARLENLWWKESNEGVLLVGNTRTDPDHLMSIELVGGELEVSQVADPETVDWRGASVLSRPEDAVTPQYD